jgi:hypothetical protein
VGTKRAQEAKARTDRDRLGKPLASYGTSAKATAFILLAVIAGLGGGAAVGASNRLAAVLANHPDGTPYAVVGWCSVALGMVSVAYGVFHLGQSFEIRRKGLRLRRRRGATEMTWDEVDHIEVFKTNIYYRGAKQRVDWEVFIYGRWDTIHLTTSFLHLVPSVVALVGLLRLHSGKHIDLPPEL